MAGLVFVELSAGGNSVRLGGGDVPGMPLYVTSDGVEGWRGTPDSKWSLTERSGGNGAFSLDDEAVLYSARTVTLHVVATSEDRAGCVAAMAELNRLVGQTARLRVVDEDDTWADGYLSVDWGAGHRKDVEGTVTVACPDPRRRSTEARRWSLAPGTGAGAGLLFDSGGCMLWPVQFGGEGVAGNAATLSNGGSSTAWPVITVSGSFPDGVTLSDGQGGQLSYGQPVMWQPLVLDCLSRTASVNGVDVTRNLTSRDFFSVPAHDTARIALTSQGNGSVEVEVRDTYI